ncbi:hypothetical protein FUAX_27230 [Fulvitalea axinellae]|uniref:GAF domain-containing protein n=1 Tax=Fulvitalea axinellae TaxID=1182444 RepID=A0AAU9CMK1_9BACT|nr:hypothetical protein FUAX_27230 [Fulvitalea axinellae]
MKKLFSKLAVGLFFLYVVGMCGVLWFLSDLPQRILAEIPMGVAETEMLESVLRDGFFVTAGTLLVGATVLLFLLLAKTGEAKKEIVYVDRISNKKDVEKSEKKSKKKKTTDIDEFRESVRSGGGDAEDMLSRLCKTLDAVQGVVYQTEEFEGKRYAVSHAAYAFSMPESERLRFEFGEGVVGQVAKEGNPLNVENVPEGHMLVRSGLGEASPQHLYVTPIRVDGKVSGVLEVASFRKLDNNDRAMVDAASELLLDSAETEAV